MASLVLWPSTAHGNQWLFCFVALTFVLDIDLRPLIILSFPNTCKKFQFIWTLSWTLSFEKLPQVILTRRHMDNHSSGQNPDCEAKVGLWRAEWAGRESVDKSIMLFPLSRQPVGEIHVLKKLIFHSKQAPSVSQRKDVCTCKRNLWHLYK